MKTVVYSLGISLAVHLIYLVGTVAIGYIKTRNHKIDLEGGWENVEIIQSEVAFGMTGSPLIFLFTFFVLSIICGLLITFFRNRA